MTQKTFLMSRVRNACYDGEMILTKLAFQGILSAPDGIRRPVPFCPFKVESFPQKAYLIAFGNPARSRGVYGRTVLKESWDEEEKEAAFKKDDVILDFRLFCHLARVRGSKASCTHSILGC